MTKPDFAELKERLVRFDEQAVNQYIGRRLDKFGDEPTYEEVAQSVHFRNVEIITELLEIIQSQSDCLVFYSSKRHPVYQEEAAKVLSETNTRLQKLREGIL